jgi:hypothetical protein
MKHVFKTRHPFKVLLLIVIIMTSSPSKAQQTAPADSGYVAANGSKVYYEV